MAQSRMEAIKRNMQSQCMNPKCNKTRWQLYRYCRTCSRKYRMYHHVDARAIKLSQYKDYVPRVRSILNLNIDKPGYKLAEQFLTALANGRIFGPEHEFHYVPKLIRQSTKFDQRTILAELGALIWADLEQNIFLADRHKVNQVGSVFLKVAGVGRMGVRNGRKVRRLYQSFGQAIWDNIGVFLLQLAKTAQKQLQEAASCAQKLAAPLDY